MAIHSYYSGSLVVSYVGESGGDRHVVVRDGRSEIERGDIDERPRGFDDREQRIAELVEFGQEVGTFTTLAEAISVAKNRDWLDHTVQHVAKAREAARTLAEKREKHKAMRAAELASGDSGQVDIDEQIDPDDEPDTELLEDSD